MAAELKLTVTPVADSADLAANTSKVKILLQILTSDGTYNLTGSTAGSLTLDGVQIASLAGKKVQLNTTTTLYSAKRTVQHDADGTKSVTVKASFDVDTSVRWIYAEKTVALPTLQRCGTVSVPEVTCGTAAAFTVTPAAEGFTHALHYAVGSRSGVAVAATAATNLSWTPPMALVNEITDSVAGEGTLTLVSYLDGAETGRRDYPLTVRVPASVVPAVALTVAVESDDAVIAAWGVAVKGRSRLRYQLTAQGAYGSTIVSRRFTFGQQTAEGASGAVVPVQSGSFVPRAAVTDSRGRTAAAALENVEVYDYSAPVLTAAQVWRSNAQGVSADDGSYAAVTAAGSCSAVGGRNALTLRCRYRPVGGTWSGYTALTGGKTQVLPGFDPAASYEVELSAVDTVGEEKTVLCTVPTQSVTFALREGGVGAAFGKYPEKAGLDMGWGVYMNGHPLTGLPAPASDSDATPWGQVNFDRIYPVGSLYLTVAATDPAVLFGGTWQRIKDTFLLAAGDTYAAGSTGGEAAHTLTEAEMPAHSHTSHDIAVELHSGGYVVMRSVGFSDQDDTRVSRTADSGGNQPHNNMPPYLAVNVWQRTA